MAHGDVTVTLRPIKFAFLVNPAERGILERVVRATLFQWGGLHNPIVPIHRRLPQYWSDVPTRRQSPTEICGGYLRLFDPDAVVICGSVDKKLVPQHVAHIHTLDEFVGDLSKEDAPTFGVGQFELLQAFCEEEFKYVRRDGTKLLMPSYGKTDTTLFKMVFGEIPSEAKRQTYTELTKRIETDEPHVTIDNFLNVIRAQHPFLSSVCTRHLEMRGPALERSLAVFLMDHTNGLDLIDFWNLRALGWHVLPIPLKVADLDDTRHYAAAFIQHHRVADDNLGGIRDPIILKGRSVSRSSLDSFVAAIPRSAGRPLTVQTWYPPMWDESTRRAGRLSCCRLSAAQARTEVSEETGLIRVKALAPTFVASHLGHGPRYANDIRLSLFGRREFGAEVMPPYSKSVARLFGIGLMTDWRAGPGGLTFLGRYPDWTIQLNHASPREVISSVLADRGWQNFEISSSGNVAYQMMRHLGNPWKLGLLKNLPLIQFLETLATGGDRLEVEEVGKRIKAGLKALGGAKKEIPIRDADRIVRNELRSLEATPFQSSDVEEQLFFNKMNQIAAGSGPFPLNVHTLVENCTAAKIFNLGIRVRCAVCEQRSWHPVEAIKAELRCPICLSTFSLPVHNPRNEIKWSYKSLGPFALPKQGFGAYSVLLSVQFLASYQNPATTPVLSFRASKNGKELEADFMMFYRGSAYWERETETVVGECKSFNGFTEKDVIRMRWITEEHPGAILVFATLAPQLSARDRRLLTPFIRGCRKYGGLDRPKNPVLILTGTELFSGIGPPQCWKEAGGAMKAFAEEARLGQGLVALCDATQQLHLGLRSWREDWRDTFEERRKANKAADPAEG